MVQAIGEAVSAVVISGMREGEVLLLDPRVVSQAPTAEGVESIVLLNDALDTLNAALDRWISGTRASAHDYVAAAERLESRQ
ncbi:MAG: hypothetical protein HY318_07315 [Armatimonadetes bacterium]|nr:hypothetical protein [Armatimonadota bacterium]